MNIDVTVSVPSFWVAISFVGTVVAFVGTFMLAMFSTPWWEDRMRSRVSKTFEKAAWEAVDELRERGHLVAGDTQFDKLTEGFPDEGKSEVERILWMEGVRPERVKIELEHDTKQTSVRNLISSQKEEVLQDHLTFSMRYGIEIVAVGFLLQLLSVIFRHIITVSF